MKKIYKHVGLSPYSPQFTDFKTFLENLNLISEEQLQLFIDYVEIQHASNFDEFVKLRVYEYGYTILELIDYVNSINYDDFDLSVYEQISMYSDPYYTRGLSRNDFI